METKIDWRLMLRKYPDDTLDISHLDIVLDSRCNTDTLDFGWKLQLKKGIVCIYVDIWDN
jgi:hypothetical protein